MAEITISKDRYTQLLRAEAHLSELENRGVDNWSGYVGHMHYCSNCDEETEWFEMDGDKCPKCGVEVDLW